MKIKTTRRYNYERNLAHKLGDKMINGQGMGEVSKLRYGLCPMSFNGCEVISVYNALQYIGKPQKLQDIAFFLEKYRMLLGFFGCNMFQLGKALDKFGADYERRDSIKGLPAFIVSFWTGRPFLSAAHTVFCVRENDRICIYNRYNNCDTVRYVKKPAEIFGKHKPIVVYYIKKPEHDSGR